MASTVNRRNLLKGLGLAGFGGLTGTAGLAGLAPHAAAAPAAPRLAGMVSCQTPDCTLMPSATVGPYYFDANEVRQDITEGRPGTPMQLVIGVVDVTTCTPIPDAIVDVWHCDAGGLYSGYNQPGGNTVGQEFMRGIQFTDANGEAAFTTVFPGWYQGRATHIHFKVRLTAQTFVTSQLFFPQATINTVYTTQAPYNTRGLNPTTNASDGIYQQMPNRERALLTVTGGASGYVASVVLGIQGFPTADEASAPAEAAPTLAAPFPNPTPSVSTLWLTLPRPAQRARAAVYDVRGREMAVLHEGPLLAGRHPVEVDAGSWPPGTYIVRADVGYTVLAERLTVVR